MVRAGFRCIRRPEGISVIGRFVKSRNILTGSQIPAQNTASRLLQRDFLKVRGPGCPHQKIPGFLIGNGIYHF
jgi:hypothetical protein